MFQSCGPYGWAIVCAQAHPNTPSRTRLKTLLRRRRRNAAVGSQQLDLETCLLPPAFCIAPCRGLPPYANYELATSHAPPELNLDAQISDLPHKETVPQTVAQVQIAFQRSARVTTAKGGGGSGGRITISNPHSWSSLEVEVPFMHMYVLDFGVCGNSQFSADDREFSCFWILESRSVRIVSFVGETKIKLKFILLTYFLNSSSLVFLVNLCLSNLSYILRCSQHDP